MNPVKATHTKWDDLALESLKGSMQRRFISTDALMVAQVFFGRGDEVPLHHHHNEQITYVLTGGLTFWFGENGEQELTVRAGEAVVIPGNLPHRALALEDTFELDIFTPPREDWLAGTDAYLRSEAAPHDGQ